VASVTQSVAPFAPGLARVGHPDSSRAASVEVTERSRVTAPSTTSTIRRLPWPTIAGDLIAGVLGIGLASLADVPMGLASALAPVLWLALLAAVRGFESREVGVPLVEATRRVLRAGAALALVLVAVAAVADLPASSGQLLCVAGAITTASLAPRAGRGAWTHLAGASAGKRTRVVVVGRHARDVERLLAEIRHTPHHALDVVAVCLAEPPGRTTLEVPVAVGLDHVSDATAAVRAQAVIMLPGDDLGDAELRRLGWQLEQTGVHLFLGMPLLDVASFRTSMAQAGGLRMLRIRPAARRGPGMLLKSLLERPLVALMLLLLAPVLIGIALAVRLDSPGPAIFRQTRVGRNGRHFTMYKLRTMSDGAHATLDDLSEQNESDGLLFKMRQDPRITRLGRVLRKYSLDEVPQLMNVVLGQMSLVGPRPALPSETANYCQDAHRRLDVKPGLTGLWQVSGRSDLSWDETVRLDVCYVENWSLGLDLVILLRTVHAVLAHRGAY
jgi:exopolysaccharide biosynthesis polyprenyl glycosylphosphotransferase